MTKTGLFLLLAIGLAVPVQAVEAGPEPRSGGADDREPAVDLEATREPTLFLDAATSVLPNRTTTPEPPASFRFVPPTDAPWGAAPGNGYTFDSPTTLSAGDFDGDGVLDLIAGYDSPRRRFLMLYLGNPNSIFPDPRLDSRRDPALETPFQGPATVMDVPVRPDFLASGDFDNDGRLDVVTAGRGTESIYFMAGAGNGNFREPRRITVAGSITDLVSGEINRRDALTDLVVAVTGAGGSALLVFEGPQGALGQDPEIVSLATPARAMALGQVVGAPARDLAILAGDELLIVEGRDRRLSASDAKRAAVAPPSIVRVGALGHAGGPADLGSPEISALVHEVAGSTPVDLAGAIAWPGQHVPTAVLPMRLNADALTDLVTLQPGAGPVVALTTFASTIVVNSALDTAVAGDGQCTLREAIDNANGNTDTTVGDCAAGSGPDSISFAIAGGGAPATISLATALPSIADSVTIDGNSQGCANPPCIVLDGSATAGVGGVLLVGGSSVLRGLVIHSFDVDGINVTSSGNFIEGNFIGTELGGNVGAGNIADGIEIFNASNNTIGGTFPGSGNLISGNQLNGILVNGALADGNLILGNRIGTNLAGTAGIGNVSDGVEIRNGGSNTVGGTTTAARNLISGNQVGVFIQDPDGSDNLILGNYIGTDASGTFSVGNFTEGIRLSDDTFDNTIGGSAAGARNLISGNGGAACQMQLGASGTVIQGNYMGTEVTGTQALPNFDAGVRFTINVPDTLVGGTVPGARNVISGNIGPGIQVQESPRAEVLGNLIGTDVGGTLALGNGTSGVIFSNSPDGIVGGPTAAARNVISANGEVGVLLIFQGTTGTVVQGNYIGTDVTGTVPIGNLLSGIEVTASSSNEIGGPVPGEGNVVVDSVGNGIWLSGDTGIQSNSNVVQGNLVGTDFTGTKRIGVTGGSAFDVSNSTANLVGGTSPGAGNVFVGAAFHAFCIRDGAFLNTVQGNHVGTDITGTVVLGNSRRGLMIDNAAQRNTIGGTTPGAANIIAGSGEQGLGIAQSTSVRNGILGNSIHSNGLLGIDLAVNGITANDAGDGDGGPNGLQNFPILSSASATPAGVTVSGQLSSRPSTTYRVELFASPTCDPSGNGEAERLLGFVSVTTNATGQASFNVMLAPAPGDGDAVTATATDNFNQTSELSPCITASCSSIVTFGPTLLATSPGSLTWGTPADVRFAKGELSDVGTYQILGSLAYVGATGVDISLDDPDPGAGLYYLVKPLGCGSWQTTLGAEPARDAALP